MNRRAFLGTLALLAAPLAAEAQQAGKVPRIGFLRSGPPPQTFVDGFQQGLHQLGYVPGQNIFVEYRFADSGTAGLEDMGSELLRLKVDIIVASATPAALAAKNPTRTVPIVLAGVLDPVDSGVVSSLSRPGGNVTGTSFMSIDLATKRVELLKEIAPHLSRLAVLGNLAHPSYASQIRAIEVGARSLGVQVDWRHHDEPARLPLLARYRRRLRALRLDRGHARYRGREWPIGPSGRNPREPARKRPLSGPEVSPARSRITMRFKPNHKLRF